MSGSSCRVVLAPNKSILGPGINFPCLLLMLWLCHLGWPPLPFPSATLGCLTQTACPALPMAQQDPSLQTGTQPHLRKNILYFKHKATSVPRAVAEWALGPSASLQHSTRIRPAALPWAGATFLEHRAARQRLPSPGGVPQHPLLPPPRKVAVGKGPTFSSRSHIHSSGAQTKAQAAASRAQNTPNPTHLQHRAAALPQGINPLCNRSAGQQGLGQLLFPWLSLRTRHHWNGMGSDLCGVLSRWCWLQPLQLVENFIYAGSLLGIHCHHGE